MPEDRRTGFTKQLNPSLIEALKEKGIAYQHRIEGKDFLKNGGGNIWLFFLCAFIVAAGIVLLRRRPETEEPCQPQTTTPRAEGREITIIAVCAAVVMMGVSICFLVPMSRHASQPVSAPVARRMIAENRGLRFAVYVYHDGSSDLIISDPNGNRPRAVFGADHATFALLAEEGIPYQTYIQNRVFGVRPGGPMLACGIALALGAVVLFCWGLGIQPFPQLPQPASEAQPKS